MIGRGEQTFRQAFQLMSDGFAWLAFIIAGLVSVFAVQLITLAYGQDYLRAAQILVIHVWAGIFVFTEALRSKWLVIHKITSFQLLSTAIGAGLNVLLNFILIPALGGYGAAIATTLSYGVAVVFSCFLKRETWAIGTVLLKSLFAPFRILETVRAFIAVKAVVDGENTTELNAQE